MLNFSLEGKIAMITGASRGIGEATAMTLADNGAHCVLVSRKAEALNEVSQKIEKNGGKATAIACHVGYLDQIKSLFKAVEEQFGRLDILINNAGTNPYFGEMLGAEEAAWDKTHDVNLKGPFFMIQHAARLMIQSGGGAIVNVSSINGIRPGIMQGMYSITKAGLISMTKAYAKELAVKNIRVNALLPGLTKTKFSKILIDTKEIYDEAVKLIPMARYAEPEEMAGAVLYLVSDAASYTTGICLTCDGGFLA
ncbi:MAG: SDR family oxidoreductase [Deltaproteobacteria bacterium]|nr:MAG: SDR family oxidoreductase [Deltaproteobacteria bacterium]